MFYTIKEAAELIGRSKTAILRSIQSGRISAHRDDMGQWRIDPAELHRVYPIETGGDERGDGSGDITGNVTDDDEETPAEVEVRVLREVIASRDRQIAGLETMVEGLENVISDLIARLDQEAADRRRAYAQLTNLLTDQRTPIEKAKDSAVPVRRWWVWWK